MSYATITLSGNLYCALLLTVNGALTQSSDVITFTFNKVGILLEQACPPPRPPILLPVPVVARKRPFLPSFGRPLPQDCSTFTVAMFTATVASTTGIAAGAIKVVAWQCSSITVTFVILGSSAPAIAAAVTTLLAAAAPVGALYNALGGITFGGAVVSTTLASTRGYYAVPYCRYYPCPSTIPFNPSYAMLPPPPRHLLQLLPTPSPFPSYFTSSKAFVFFHSRQAKASNTARRRAVPKTKRREVVACLPACAPGAATPGCSRC